MKIFISWSGERSEALAKGLREWLPLVLHFVKPWLSQSDIQPGERWSLEVAKELEECNFGIICITKDNLDSPWILFESGALAKSMQDGRVIPLVLDLDFKEISGPLAQFQSKKVEFSGIKELIFSLNKASQEPVPEQQIETLFDLIWPKFEKLILELPKTQSSSKQTRTQGDILEELVSSVRNVELRVRDIVEEGQPVRRKRRPKYYPMMLMDTAHSISEGPSDPIKLLFISSIIKEDAPWISEMAIETYRSIVSGDHFSALQLQRKLTQSLEMLRRNPFGEELGIDVREAIAMIRDLLPPEEILASRVNVGSQRSRPEKPA